MMSSHDSPKPIYSPSELYCIHLRQIHVKITTEVLHFVFLQGLLDKSPNISLLEYYAEKNLAINKFKKSLSRDQIQKIESDPDGESYDITLFYACLRRGCHGLADDLDAKWKEGNDSLESNITTIKGKRNKLSHEGHPYTDNEFEQEINDIENILKNIIVLAGQHYQIPREKVDAEVNKMHHGITKFRFGSISNLNYEEQVRTEGVKDTLEQYDKCFEGEVSTVNHLIDIHFSVDKIYTEVTLHCGPKVGEGKPIKYEDVLADDNGKEIGDVVLVSGEAGAGKTTFIKKLLVEWRAKNVVRDLAIDLQDKKMRYLDEYDHLLKVDCRNTAIKSFEELLQHLMPRVSRTLHVDLKKVILYQKVLVIIDGLDEMNESSALLVKEVLNLKKKFETITVLVTSRPEKLEYIEHHLKQFRLRSRHIQLMGISADKREEFVAKYSAEIGKQILGAHDVGELQNYLRTTGHHLSDLWKSPYNLTLLIMLWAKNRFTTTSINTAPELYREIFRLYRSKLKDRLRSYRSIEHLHDSELESKIDSFMDTLTEESFSGLKNDCVGLPDKAYQRIKNACDKINVPIEEMISAFLNRTPGATIVYTFPHKGMQDFLAARYFWMKIKSKEINHDQIDYSHSSLENSLKARIYKSLPRRKKSKHASYNVRYILLETHESKKPDLSRFYDMFLSLIGMFYLEDEVIEESIKFEVMKLLQATGIQSPYSWMKVLNSVKCDPYVAKFISEQPKILRGIVTITDFSVSAYISLMEALTPCKEDSDKVKINIKIIDELEKAPKLLKLISNHRYRVNSIEINDQNYDGYVPILKELKDRLRDACDTKVAISVRKHLFETKDLLEGIKIHNFQISSLNTKEKTLWVVDDTICDQIGFFKNIQTPRLEKDCKGIVVNMRINEKLAEARVMMNELVKWRFPATINLLGTFMQPMNSQRNLVAATNKVFRRCKVSSFLGCLAPGLKIPKSVKRLAVSISPENCDKLIPFLRSRDSLEHLSLCLPLQVLDSLKYPLPVIKLLNPNSMEFPVNLFLPDIGKTEEDVTKVCTLIEKLRTITIGKTFYGIYFPRCTLGTADILTLLYNLCAAHVCSVMAFPTSCCPSSPAEKQGLQKFSTTSGLLIKWGKIGSGLYDLDIWWDAQEAVTCEGDIDDHSSSSSESDDEQ